MFTRTVVSLGFPTVSIYCDRLHALLRYGRSLPGWCFAMLLGLPLCVSSLIEWSFFGLPLGLMFSFLCFSSTRFHVLLIFNPSSLLKLNGCFFIYIASFIILFWLVGSKCSSFELFQSMIWSFIMACSAIPLWFSSSFLRDCLCSCSLLTLYYTYLCVILLFFTYTLISYCSLPWPQILFYII
jgi:hypothetical protein